MVFPERPTCHGSDWQAQRIGSNRDVFVWRPPMRRGNEGLIDAGRTCGYCGSLHPEDLLRVLADEKTEIGGADWKYGWPHKFYINVPNPEADLVVKIGGSYRDGIETPIMGKREFLHHKFYNEHLKDDGFDDQALNAVLAVLHLRGGVRFQVDMKDGEKILRYAAPYHGYQR